MNLLWLLPLCAYVLGSVSPAWLAGKLKGKDLRQHGSGNLGATNAGRVLGGRWFAIVFVADLAKGVLPVLAASFLAPDAVWLAIACGLGAVLGHVFTCFHGFKGGKAVATSLGVVIGLTPLVAACCAAVWLLAWLFGWKALRLGKSGAVGLASSIAALVPVPAHSYLHAQPWGLGAPIGALLALLSVLIIVRHRSNLAKLFQPKPAAR